MESFPTAEKKKEAEGSEEEVKEPSSSGKDETHVLLLELENLR